MSAHRLVHIAGGFLQRFNLWSRARKHQLLNADYIS